MHAWRDGYLTAASTPADQPFGLVFVDSIVTGEPEVKTYLGRPWRDFAQTTFVADGDGRGGRRGRLEQLGPARA